MCRMIISVGECMPGKMFSAAQVMSEGLSANHEYAEVGPTGQPGGIRHVDGWGAAVRNNASLDVSVMRGDGPIANVKPGLPGGTGSDNTVAAMIVHVRNATLEEQKGLKYTHPIIVNIDDNESVLFFHQGYIAGIQSLISEKEETEWDSLNLCKWLLPGLHSKDVSVLKARLEAVSEIEGSMNCAIMWKRQIVVCNWFNSSHEEYYTMYRMEHRAGTIISSDIITELGAAEQWTPMENRTIIRFPLGGDGS